MIQEPMIDPRYLNTLRRICDRLNNRPLKWVVTGSLGMALQGMDIKIHDIDIQTDQNGVYEIERLFSEYVVKPVHYLASERMRSHFGNLEIDGVKIDIMGDVQKLMDDQTLEEPVNVERHLRWVNFDNLFIPVLSLEYEYVAYLKMGRIKKAEKIKNWLDGDLIT
jgi:hypothetical protein